MRLDEEHANPIDPQESKATFIHSEDGLADRIV